MKKVTKLVVMILIGVLAVMVLSACNNGGNGDKAAELLERFNAADNWLFTEESSILVGGILTVSGIMVERNGNILHSKFEIEQTGTLLGENAQSTLIGDFFITRTSEGEYKHEFIYAYRSVAGETMTRDDAEEFFKNTFTWTFYTNLIQLIITNNANYATIIEYGITRLIDSPPAKRVEIRLIF